MAAKKHKRKRQTPKRRNASYTVYDGRGKSMGSTKSKKGAQLMARAAGGYVTRKGKAVYPANRNPAGGLPVGRMVTVRARRRADGRIDLFRAR